MTYADQRPAAAGQVERRVRPIGYLHGEDFIPHGPNGWTGGVPVFDQAALDAAVAAERERWRGLVQEALDADTNDYVLGSELADRMRAALRL